MLKTLQTFEPFARDATMVSQISEVAVKMAKIHFTLEVEDGFPPVGVETLNARVCGDGTYEILNTPFFVKETAYNDVVVADLSDDGRLEFRECAKPSSFKAISIILLDAEMPSHLIDDFQGRNCIIEYGEFPGYRMLAIAIPQSTDYVPIKAFLVEYEKGCRLSYAELVA